MKIYAFFPLAFLAMTGCDTTTPTGGFTGVPAIRIAGVWTFTGDVTDSAMMGSCQMNGTANFNQNNDTFNGLMSNGVQVCHWGGETYEDPLYGFISLGEVAGESVRFTSFGGTCLHLGMISPGSPANHMVGTFNCSFELPPQTRAHPFSGTWQANR